MRRSREPGEGSSHHTLPGVVLGRRRLVARGAGVRPPAGDVEELPGEAQFNQCRKLPPGKRVKVTLKPESELNDLIGWISTMTCKKFIIPQNIRSQKVTIISPVPVSPEEGYRLFLSALNSIGLTVAPAGDALQVVETPRIKEEAPVYRPDETAPTDDRYITRLVRLQNVAAAEIGAVLQKLRSKYVLSKETLRSTLAEAED